MDTDLRPGFEDQIEPFRGELRAHCYRMLGSLQDAEDALQESLLAAWKGLDRFEGRSSLRTWLYRIATNVCLRQAERRPARVLSMDHGPAFTDVWEVGAWSPELPWLEPCPGFLVDAATPSVDPAYRYEVRESLELAFVSAFQHLPPTQRAVLILRDVLTFPAADVAAMLDTSVASVNSALQRAKASLEDRRPSRSQGHALADLGEGRVRELVGRIVAAWDAGDVPAILDLLTDDVQFGMPPFPAWFDGREAVARFLTERVFATPWRLAPSTANGQIAFAAYQQNDPGGRFELSAINVMTLEGDRFSGIMGFLDRAVFAAFDYPAIHPDPARMRGDR
jgi:RNA polymerase sigma-70 factor (ECF subfamily)